MRTTASRTIDLTRIKGDHHYREVLKKKFDYDAELDKRAAFKLEFLDQKARAEELYDRQSLDHVASLIEGVEEFLVRSLGKGDLRAPGIHSETLLLDMQTSDHEMIFNRIEKTVKKHSNNFLVMRLKSNINRKKIPDFLEPTRQSKRVFLIVEQTESFDRAAFETLAGYFKGRLLDSMSPTNTVLILFCFSTSSQYPIDLTESFGIMRGIYKQTNDSNAAKLRLLLRSQGLKVKLNPAVLNYIYDQAVNSDPSSTNIKFLHIFSLFEHYRTSSSLLSGDESAKLEEEHQNLCDDMFCLAVFLKESEKWPHDASDLYDALLEHDDLAKSEKFYDALQLIKSIPKERKRERFAKVSEESRQCSNKEVSSLILSFEDVIENKEDRTRLIKELMNYTRGMKCSFERHKYFSDPKALMSQCFTAPRFEVPQTFLDEGTYFGAMLNQIMHSDGNESISELYYGVEDEFKKLIRSSRAKGPADGIARAVFVDIVESMEHQNIIKIDSRAKSKVFRRLAWPLPTCE